MGLGVAEGDGRGVAGVAVGFGVADGSGVPLGLALGSGVAGAPGEGLGVSFFGGLVFFFLREGVGVGVRTKKSLTFFENDSSSSSVARTGPTTTSAVMMMTSNRNIRFMSGCPKAQAASSCKTALFIRMPASRFSSGKFSLGE
jgi:hypothetical protein